MTNHPNRSRSGKTPGRNPSPDEVRAVRQAAGLTQTDAARLIYASLRAWQQWEAGGRKMHPAFWELFKIRLGNLG